METNLYNRVVATVLALATVALGLFAVFNLQQEGQYQQPDDGVSWTETQSAVLPGLIAVHVQAGSPGAQAGIEPGDLLTAVNDHTVDIGADLNRELKHTDVYGQANYSIIRRGVLLEAPVVVIPVPADRTLINFTRFSGLIYLAIGMYVLFRRWTAPQATHFYIFCLVSFALNTFHYTGKLDLLDWTIYWGNVLAEALQPALFLHFALVFPGEVRPEEIRFSHPRAWYRRWLVGLIYLPALAVVGIRVAAMLLWQATFALRLRLDQIATAYVAAYFVIAAVLFLRSYARANTPLLRQQLKWLTRGTSLAVLPFTLLYALPFLTGTPVPVNVQKLAELSLVILPLTFSWAIVRYRLMDTDLIFKRGVAYTLATGTLVGVYFGAVALVSEQIHTHLPKAVQEWGLVVTILVTAQLFDPLKRRFQTWVDTVFDRHKYDYRKALVEFGRGLSSETDLDAVLRSIVDRLPSTLLVAKVAVFLADDPANLGAFRLAASHGLPFSDGSAPADASAPALDLGFFDFDAGERHSHIFFENAQYAIHLREEEQRTAALLDLNYYLPCRVQEATPTGGRTRTIAVIGLGRTLGGDFLSSEDVELLESLASYIGIALQSASLYARLEEQVAEFERLKEFNENIVESINVGILAVDLEDRIESWNAQMEAMYALSRREAIGQPLTQVFPPEFIEAFDRFRNESGVHHLYKFRLTTRAGEARTANIAVAPLLSRDFVAVGRIVLVDDITERVTLEAQLSQADKLSSIGLLAAGVAHEINTPLAVISSYAQMLTKQMKGDARLTPLLERITQQTFRASEIANGLLNFSRTSTTEFRETDLNQVIHDTLALVEHQMKTARITVAMELAGDLPRIQGNPGKLQQVFLNLLLNAKDAMPQGGELRVGTLANGHVEAFIADSGGGIAPENLKRIYDPFFTTKSAPKPGERRGTGLGLSVSYGIIQEHAGKINVESTVGIGTTFHLEFPLSRNSVHA